jgi:hypothetical protein
MNLNEPSEPNESIWPERIEWAGKTRRSKIPLTIRLA